MCTAAQEGNGRTISIPEDEVLQHRLRKLQAAPSGRTMLRERTGVEHHLAHLSQRQGRRARYRGIRKNTFDVRRAAAIQNLESIQRRESADAEMRRAS
jgi:IS5 family transposase